MSLNLVSLIPGVGESGAHVVTLGLVTTGLLYLGLKARSQLVGVSENESVVPADHLCLRGIFELLVEFITNLSDMILGHDGRSFVPFFASIFIFILINNIAGVIPGVMPATENFNTTFSMGTVMFVFYNLIGFRKNGWGHIKHLMGPVLWLSPLMFLVELISHLVRPLSLGLRLANVLRGDHIVVGIFSDLSMSMKMAIDTLVGNQDGTFLTVLTHVISSFIPSLLPIPFYILGLFVCFVQAFVFTLLSMVYVALAGAHEH